MPEYHSPFAMPVVCTDPKQAKEYSSTHATECTYHAMEKHKETHLSVKFYLGSKYDQNKVDHILWWKARHAFATAEEFNPRLLKEMLRYVSMDCPPDAPKRKTVAKKSKISTPDKVELAGTTVMVLLVWVAIILPAIISFFH